MNSNLGMDTEALEKIVSQLEAKVLVVKELFDDIDDKMKTFDGSSDVWKGVTQKSVYSSYQTISNEFPIIEEQLDNYNKFLRKTIENYTATENKIDDSVDANAADLNVN